MEEKKKYMYQKENSKRRKGQNKHFVMTGISLSSYQYFLYALHLFVNLLYFCQTKGEGHRVLSLVFFPLFSLQIFHFSL